MQEQTMNQQITNDFRFLCDMGNAGTLGYRFLLWMIMVVLLLPVIGGCGAKRTRNVTTNREKGVVQFSIRWPDRTRLVPRVTEYIDVSFVDTGNAPIQLSSGDVNGTGVTLTFPPGATSTN